MNPGRLLPQSHLLVAHEWLESMNLLNELAYCRAYVRRIQDLVRLWKSCDRAQRKHAVNESALFELRNWLNAPDVEDRRIYDFGAASVLSKSEDITDLVCRALKGSERARLAVRKKMLGASLALVEKQELEKS